MAEQPWHKRLLHNGELYRRYNQQRIEFLRRYLPGRTADILDLVPFLLHECDHELPGTRETGCEMAGISGYAVTQPVKRLVRQYFPSFTPRRQAKHRLPIVFLALIGSAGSVTFTPSSDLDLWVGMERERATPEELLLYEEKLRCIESWVAESFGIEMHMFVADPGHIRRNDYGTLVGESCGTALGKLLKDEFYRTAVFLQGQLPLYWLMPVGITDMQYERNVAALELNPQFPHDHYVDLGHVHTIAPGEFFGAALWHLLKSLSAPFKSILKLAVLDMYSREGGSCKPLCEHHKEQILGGRSAAVTDPHLLMVEKLRDFYAGQENEATRSLIEESFLIHNLLRTGHAARNEKARTEYFVQFGRRWGYDRSRIAQLAGYREWNYIERERIHSRLVACLAGTYLRIRRRTIQSSIRISDKDLTVAGRRLKAVLERKPGKIPYEISMFRGPETASIDIHEPKGTSKWRAGIRLRNTDATDYQIARELPTPIAACAWCSYNGFHGRATPVKVRGRTALTGRAAGELIEILSEFFPTFSATLEDRDALLVEPHLTHLYLVPNWHDPEQGRELLSLVALSRHSNGELFHAEHRGSDCLEWLTRHLVVPAMATRQQAPLTWAVHLSRGQVGSTRRPTELVCRHMRSLVDAA